MQLLKIVLLSVVGWGFFTGASLAVTDRFSLLSYPATGPGDFLALYRSVNPPARSIRFSSDIDFSYAPMELTVGGAVFRGVVDSIVVQHIGVAWAPADWWELEAVLPLVWSESFTDPEDPVAMSATALHLGDVALRGRFVVQDSRQHAVGVALLPFITIPNGEAAYFVGDTRPTGGGIAVLDAQWGPCAVGLNVGVEGRERVQLHDLDFASRLLVGAGGVVPLGDDVSFGLQVSAATSITAPFQDRRRTAAELRTGLSYRSPKDRLTARVGASLPLVRGAGVPAFRILAGFTYRMTWGG
ncbi:MAG: hypothetical protein HY696_06905 [Deltaproteobacteria bacterium]|nr:hypothetical protein [Deltaproteobacteria bacterium]